MSPKSLSFCNRKTNKCGCEYMGVPFSKYRPPDHNQFHFTVQDKWHFSLPTIHTSSRAAFLVFALCGRMLAWCSLYEQMSPVRESQRLHCEMSTWVRWLHVFIVPTTSGATVVRLKERAAALGQNLKIGESSEAVPQAARKCFDFSSPLFWFYKNIQ